MHPRRYVCHFGVVVFLCAVLVFLKTVKNFRDICEKPGLWHFSFLVFPTFLLRLLLMKMKSKDGKDKEKLSRHQCVPATFSGVPQCSACDKSVLGKESFQCSSKFSGLVCDVCVFVLLGRKLLGCSIVAKHININLIFYFSHTATMPG